MTEEELYSKIDLHLRGKLENDVEFLKEINQNPSLAESVEIEKELRNVVVDYNILSIVSELDSIKKEVELEKRNKIIRNTFLGAIGIAFSVYLAFLFFDKKHIETKPLKTDSPVKAKEVSKIEVETKVESRAQIQKVNKEDQVTLTKQKESNTYLPIQEKSLNGLNNKTEETPSISNNEKTKEENAVIKKQHTDLQLKSKENNAEKDEPKLDIEKEPVKVPAKKQVGGNYVFEPTSETWNVPIESEKRGVFSVMDKSGTIQFKKPFEKNEILHWDGNSTNGVLLKIGLYLYHIDYEDGSFEQGTITLSY